MSTNIISVSIPKELADFLDENSQISPSKVLQEQLFRIKEEESRLQERVKVYEIRNYKLQALLNKVLAYCEEQKFIIPENVLA